jgi:hypothetical protein
MTIYKNKHSNYSAISNAVIENHRLSWEARGLLIYILSKPNNSRAETADLARRSAGGGDEVQRIFGELETFGYLVMEQGEWVIQESAADSRGAA